MAAATKTAAPTRGRATTKTTAKSTAAKPTSAPAPTNAAVARGATSDEDLAKVGPIDLEFSHETKNYAVFTPPKGTGCVGSFYAPPGTTQVRVMLYGSAEALAE